MRDVAPGPLVLSFDSRREDAENRIYVHNTFHVIVAARFGQKCFVIGLLILISRVSYR
jgi:hypothetical protein